MEWRNIKGYDGCYKVSSDGRIKSTKRTVDRILKPSVSSGYLYVNLCKGGSYKPHRIHRIVADEFLGDHCGKMEVNHKDGNKFNNCVSNLEWCTHKENIKHAVDHGLFSHILTSDDVDCIRDYYKNGGSLTYRDMADKYGVKKENILYIVRRSSQGNSDKMVDFRSGRSINENTARKIKHDLACGVKGIDIASKYNVSTCTVSAIKNGRRWNGV